MRANIYGRFLGLRQNLHLPQQLSYRQTLTLLARHVQTSHVPVSGRPSTNLNHTPVARRGGPFTNLPHTPVAGFDLLYLHFSTSQGEKSFSDCLDSEEAELRTVLSRDMLVRTEFITVAEEESLLDEVDKYMRRLRYEFDHWDNAIHGYRETEKKSWNASNLKIIQRVKDLAFSSNVAPLAYVHILDIAKEGYIKPHVDAVRFCGDTIAGICLLSSCVMRLALESDSTKYADVFLPRRSLYIMKDRARYEFTHEVLKDDLSYFRGQRVPRDRRISVICRNEPTENTPNT